MFSPQDPENDMEIPGYNDIEDKWQYSDNSEGSERSFSSNDDDDSKLDTEPLDPFHTLPGLGHLGINPDWKPIQESRMACSNDQVQQQPQPEEAYVETCTFPSSKPAISPPLVLSRKKPATRRKSTKSKANKPIKNIKKKRVRVRKVYEPPMEKRVYVDFDPDKDVAMGRGGKTNKNPGNLAYHQEKRTLQVAYKAADKAKRTDIAQKLVDHVQARGGRFLKYDKGLGWYQVSNHTARTKASQALRENYTLEERAQKRANYRQKKKAATKQ